MLRGRSDADSVERAAVKEGFDIGVRSGDSVDPTRQAIAGPCVEGLAILFAFRTIPKGFR
jgi:hypothetical protein